MSDAPGRQKLLFEVTALSDHIWYATGSHDSGGTDPDPRPGSAAGDKIRKPRYWPDNHDTPLSCKANIFFGTHCATKLRFKRHVERSSRLKDGQFQVMKGTLKKQPFAN